MRRGILPRLVAGAAVLTLVASCGGGDEGGEEKGSSFSMQGCEPKHFIPGHSTELCGSQLLRYMYTGLITFDKKNEPVNAMAESVESKDQKVWDIKIKKGWKFHNGEKVTIDSFIDAWNAYAYGPHAYDTNYFFEKIRGYTDLNPTEEGAKPKTKKLSGLKKVNDYEMQVTLTDPFGQFPLVLGYGAFTPLPKKGIEAAEQGPSSEAYKAYEAAPVGNGPYQMDGKWKHNQEINVKRYKGYKGSDKGHVDRISYRIFAEEETAYQELVAGNLDQTAVPSSKIPEAKTQLGDRFFQQETSQLTRLDFPMYDKRFKNKDLRHAISMAIDRKQISDKIFDNATTPAKSLITPVVAGQRPNACKEYCEYNPKRAKQLFDEAGGFDGTLKLWYNTDGGHEPWVKAVANQLRNNLGVKVALEKQLQSKYLTAQQNKEMDGLYRNSWVMDYPSMQNYLEPIYGTGGSANRTFYTNKKVDKYIDQGNQQPTVEKGYPYYYKAEDQILEDMPVIPMFHHNSPQAYSEHVKNVRLDAFAYVVLTEIQIAD